MQRQKRRRIIQINKNTFFKKLLTSCDFADRIKNRTNVRETQGEKTMEKTELTEMLDKLSDRKLDAFIGFLCFLRDTSGTEQPPAAGPRECLEGTAGL